MLQNKRNSSYNTTMNSKPSWQTVIVSYFGAKHKHETHTLLRLCLIKFLSTHILRRGKGLVDYQGREQQGWEPVWPLYQSRKLHSALSDIVSLVDFFFVKKRYLLVVGSGLCHEWISGWVSERCMYVTPLTPVRSGLLWPTNQIALERPSLFFCKQEQVFLYWSYSDISDAAFTVG